MLELRFATMPPLLTPQIETRFHFKSILLQVTFLFVFCSMVPLLESRVYSILVSSAVPLWEIFPHIAYRMLVSSSFSLGFLSSNHKLVYIY